MQDLSERGVELEQELLDKANKFLTSFAEQSKCREKLSQLLATKDVGGTTIAHMELII